MKIQLLLILSLAFCYVTSVRAETFITGDGYEFEVNLKPQKEVVMIGEPTYIDFEIKNLSKVVLVGALGSDSRNEFGRPDSFEVDVCDSRGNQLPKIPVMNFGGLSTIYKLSLGESRNVRLYLSHWATIQEPGKYKVFINQDLALMKYSSGANISFAGISGVKVNLTSNLQVVPNDTKKLADVVNEIGSKLASGDDTARRLVPFINDVRIIPFLTETIKKDATMIRSLAKFDNDEALAGIISLIDDEDQEVRRSVSVALTLSVHPKSKLYLLGMRTDENVGIRLDVIHYLGKTNTVESTRILKEMVNDVDQKWIGSEARRYLKERGVTIE